MAEHVVLLMLALAQDLPGYFQNQAERQRRHFMDERPMRDLFGRTVETHMGRDSHDDRSEQVGGTSLLSRRA